MPGTNDVVAGDLTVAPPRGTLRAADQQPGCDVAAGDMVREAYEVTRDTVGMDWLAVCMVASKPAVLHPAPRRDDRQVRYLGGDKPVTGWLQAADLVSQPWPAPR